VFAVVICQINAVHLESFGVLCMSWIYNKQCKLISHVQLYLLEMFVCQLSFLLLYDYHCYLC